MPPALTPPIIVARNKDGRWPRLNFGVGWDSFSKVGGQPPTAFKPLRILRENVTAMLADGFISPEHPLAKLSGVGKTVIDIDASALFFDAAGRLVDGAFATQDVSADDAALYSGDDTWGVSGGEDEQVVLNLNLLSPQVQTIMLLIAEDHGRPLSSVTGGFWRLAWYHDDQQIMYQIIDDQITSAALACCTIQRQGDGFAIQHHHAAVADENNTTLENWVMSHAVAAAPLSTQGS